MTNITLIGMSGAGKSFVGERLAKALGLNFVDVDILLEERHGEGRQQILDRLGDDEYVRGEAAEVATLAEVQNTVIAPGGSIVYSPEATQLLKGISRIVYLEIDPRVIQARTDASTRGIVGLKDKSFEELYAERQRLYEDAADMAVCVEGKTPEEVIEAIRAGLL